MTYSRKKAILFGGAALTCAAVFVMQADSPEWIRLMEGGSAVERIFFRAFPLPAGPVAVRVPSKEARAGLDKLIASSPAQADLYSLRAREEEVLLDFGAAEQDWKKYAELSADKAAGNLALADNYHRQLKVKEEMDALRTAAAVASPASEKFVPEGLQRSWKTFERMLWLCQKQLLDHAEFRETYRRWTERYPQSVVAYRNWVNAEIAAKQTDRVEPMLAEFAKRFPSDSFPLEARAAAEKAKGNTQGALAVYDRAFEPLWSPTLIRNYFAMLRDARALPGFLQTARAESARNPLALGPTARLFHYYLEAGNADAAKKILADYRRRKEAQAGSWTPQELLSMATLWGSYLNDRNESARFYYALYSAKGASNEDREKALAAIVQMLFAAAEPRLPLGGGDLSLYKDIASADPYPGFLNGVLSLLLNSADPAYRFADQETKASGYFQRAKAAELLELFERQFPSSTSRGNLRAQLVEAYSLHGENAAVLTSGRKFLTDFPDSASRVNVSLQMADAYARANQVTEELAIYDNLLAELARKADGVPLGQGVVTNPGQAAGQPRGGPRSYEYSRVLDRNLSRLVALRRVRDALTLLRREIDRNANDPGLYDRLAVFLDQNKLAAEIEGVYRKAMAQFPERDWHHKLARFYLRQKQNVAFQTLTADIAKVFSGSELERYFREVIGGQNLDGVLYRQVNLYAHQRFPHDLMFVNNLLRVYRQKGTADPVAYESLLRRYWFYDNALRAQYFEHLQSTGKLRTELQALSAMANPQTNPAAARMLVEAESWRSHFEDAAPAMLVLAKDSPGEESLGTRTASLYRSLAAYDARRAQDSAEVEANLIRANPRDTAARTRLGELSREYRQVASGRDAWKAIPDLEPGSSDGYIEAATVHWDYFEFDEALQQIANARRKLKDPVLFAYEAGAIYENKRQYDRAIAEYVQGALAEAGSSAQFRLLALARRPQYRQNIDDATLRLVNGAEPSTAAVTLRIALLEEQQRKADLEAFLLNLTSQARGFDLLTKMEEESRRLAFPNVEERAITREIELTPDAMGKLKLRLQLAKFYENQRNTAAAARTIDALQRENPMLLGVMRAAVNYHWRNKNGTRAVELLTGAATSAHATLRPQLEFEASGKASDSGRFEQARSLLNGLLRTEPYNAAYLSAMADTYAREGNDSSLRSFYQEKIALLEKAPLSATERVERVAAMRRSLIPVLTRAKDYTAGVDQYIEVVNKYPEDARLLEEAAGYAQRNQLAQRLTAYYEKTSTDSPKDARWPVVLARLYTSLEDYPAAIGKYTRATEIRPDRSDLLAARGALEERLLRFDEAAVTYLKVYELTYRTSAWMERIAEIRARQGRTDDSVAALRTALLEGRENSATSQFDVAQRLDSWGMTEQALPFAERGVTLAGAKLLDEYVEGAQVYARVMARLRRYAAAHAKAPKGELLIAMARVVKSDYNAQEKTQFAAFLERVKNVATPDVGRAAGLPAWEAKRTYELLLANANKEGAQGYVDRLKQLQMSRMQFGELGTQLEAYAALLPNEERSSPRLWAAEAFRAAGDEAGELRALSGADSSSMPRYLALLARRNPTALTALASNAAVNAAIESGKQDLVMSTLQARAQSLPAVWLKSYTGLAGLYLGWKNPEVDTAFREGLGPSVIAERIGTPVDRQQRIAGDVWYYYGSRYAEYLDVQKKAEANDYLASMVEATPGRAQAYVSLADYEAESGRLPLALADYEHALQLQPRSVSAIDGGARVLWAQNQQEAAKQRWRAALDALAEQFAATRVRSTGVTELRGVLEQLASRRLLAEMRPQIEPVVVGYVKRFGSAQSDSVMRYFDVPWIVSVSRSASNPVDFLSALIDADWIPQAQKDLLHQRLLEAASAKHAAAVGEARTMAWTNLMTSQWRYVDYLLDQKQPARAAAVIASWTEETRRQYSNVMAGYDMRIAALSGKLEELLDRYREDASKAPDRYQVREAAMNLQSRDAAASRRLMRFYYEKELEDGNIVAANFLGLAEVLLQEKKTDEAVRVLRRMALVSQPAFVNLKEAGLLLRRFQRDAEAAVFLEESVKAVPWDKDAKEALASLKSGSKPPVLTVNQLEAEIRNSPDDAGLKLTYFRAARQAGRHRAAANAMELVLGNSMSTMFHYDDNPEGESSVNDYWVESFLSGQNLTDAERAAYALELSDALGRTERLQGALSAAQVAQRKQASNAAQARIASLRAQLERRRINQERKPVVGDSIEQDKPVRPMLVAQGGAR